MTTVRRCGAQVRIGSGRSSPESAIPWRPVRGQGTAGVAGGGIAGISDAAGEPPGRSAGMFGSSP